MSTRLHAGAVCSCIGHKKRHPPVLLFTRSWLWPVACALRNITGWFFRCCAEWCTRVKKNHQKPIIVCASTRMCERVRKWRDCDACKGDLNRCALNAPYNANTICTLVDVACACALRVAVTVCQTRALMLVHTLIACRRRHRCCSRATAAQSAAVVS